MSGCVLHRREESFGIEAVRLQEVPWHQVSRSRQLRSEGKRFALELSYRSPSISTPNEVATGKIEVRVSHDQRLGVVTALRFCEGETTEIGYVNPMRMEIIQHRRIVSGQFQLDFQARLLGQVVKQGRVLGNQRCVLLIGKNAHLDHFRP